MSARSEADRMQTWFAPFTRYERDWMLDGEERNGHRAIWDHAQGDLIQRMLYVDCHTWLVDTWARLAGVLNRRRAGWG